MAPSPPPRALLPAAVAALLAGGWPLWPLQAAGCSVSEHGWIRVAQHGDRWVLVDEHDREMLLRGVNINLQAWRPAGEDRPMDPAAYAGGRCPPNKPGIYRNPPICGVQAGLGKYNQSTGPESGNDLAQVRALGFGVVRLGISWSLLEPSPAQYSAEYLDRIAQVVDWAREQDVRVILDMHQDLYSTSLRHSSSNGSHGDGAPAWAVLNSSIDRFPRFKRWIFDAVGFEWQTVAAFEAFYGNAVPPGSGLGWGLQEHYIRCWAQVVSRFRDDPVVLGFELMNEPAPSEVDLLHFSNELLYPFYRRTIQALTGVRDGMPDCPAGSPVGRGCAFPDLGLRDTRHVIFFEPMAVRNQLDVSIQTSRPFTEYANIVYAPHTYTYSFTVKIAGLSPISGYGESLRTAWKEATQMRAGVLVTEFGASEEHPERLEGITKWQDTRLTGSTFWVWKESGGGWGLWDGDMGQPGHRVRPERLRALSHSRPLAVSGALRRLDFDAGQPCGTTMKMSAFAAPGVQSPTLVYVPASAGAAEPAVAGAAVLQRRTVAPDGSTTLEVLPNSTTGGEYTVTVRTRESGCPEGGHIWDVIGGGAFHGDNHVRNLSVVIV